MEFFAAHPEVEGTAQALRVSRYRGGAGRPAHTRLSVWEGERAVSAISLDDAETARLSRFLSETPTSDPAAVTQPLPIVPG